MLLYEHLQTTLQLPKTPESHPILHIILFKIGATVKERQEVVGKWLESVPLQRVRGGGPPCLRRA